MAARNADVTRALTDAFAARNGARQGSTRRGAAASIMAMNNVYYRFTHLVGGDYATLPARLRMNVMAQPGVGEGGFSSCIRWSFRR